MKLFVLASAACLSVSCIGSAQADVDADQKCDLALQTDPGESAIVGAAGETDAMRDDVRLAGTFVGNPS